MRSLLLFILLLLMCFLSVLQVSSQVVRRKADNINPDFSKGILTIYSSLSGDLYVNDYMLAGMEDDDTLYAVNMEKGSYSVQLKRAGFESKKLYVEIKADRVTDVTILSDTVFVNENRVSYSNTIEYITGKQLRLIKDKAWHMDFQYSLFSVHRLISFNGGYQIMPALCPGIGFIYNSNEQHFANGAVRVIPVYLHLRGYFIQGKFNPYIKFDLGITYIPNKDKRLNGIWGSSEDKNGLYYSPGVGLRYNFSKNFYFITQAELLHLEYKTKEILVSGSSTHSYNQHSTDSYFEVNIGIGIQL